MEKNACCVIVVVIALILSLTSCTPEVKTPLTELGIKESEVTSIHFYAQATYPGNVYIEDPKYSDCLIDDPAAISNFLDIFQAIELTEYAAAEEYTQHSGVNATYYFRIDIDLTSGDTKSFNFRHFYNHKFICLGEENPKEIGAWRYEGQYNEQSIPDALRTAWREAGVDWEYVE